MSGSVAGRVRAGRAAATEEAVDEMARATETDAAGADRVREAEAYDLRRAQQVQVVAVDCPTSRLLAVGAAAVGAEVVLASHRGGAATHAGFLLPGGRCASPDPAEVFIAETLRHWFADARALSVSTAADGLAGLLETCGGSDGRPQLLVLPAEPWALLATCDLLLDERVRNRSDLAVRLVAAGTGGCCIVSPRAEDYDAQVEALLDMADRGAAGDAPADAALIAAGTLLHEMRLLGGASVGEEAEAFPMSAVCRLRLPPPVEGSAGSRRWVCVGAGGIGGALCLLGLCPIADAGDRLLLVDGDVVEPHNLLLHRHAGAPKVEAVREEIRRMCAPLDVTTLVGMVDETTALPGDHDLLVAVTDSAASRLLAQEAFFREEGCGVMVSAGSTLTGAEGFYVGGAGRAACIRCRLPFAEAEAAPEAACSRRPASFASNMIAAGLALALALRGGAGEFCTSPTGLSRFGFATERPERFGAYLPQRCAHPGSEERC